MSFTKRLSDSFQDGLSDGDAIILTDEEAVDGWNFYLKKKFIDNKTKEKLELDANY